MSIEIIPASQFSIQELTELYNHTRVDYLVPMPMSAERLANYIRDFDVRLDLSLVARDTDGEILGLSMMGLRQHKAWITRLGVLPTDRRRGVGRALMEGMLANADKLHVPETDLEVIENNTPAHTLFVSTGFEETSRYLVMRKAPNPNSHPVQAEAAWMDRETAIEALHTYPHHLTWINAVESMENAPDVEGLGLELKNGGVGWLVFRHHKCLLSHLILHTEQGDPGEVGTQLLLNLQRRYPNHDTYAENILENDAHLNIFRTMGFFENFARIEMKRLRAN